MATARSSSASGTVMEESQPQVTSHSLSKGSVYRHNAAVHPEQNAVLQTLVRPHVGSFDFLLGEGLQRAVDDLDVVEVNVDGQPNILLWFENVQISYPSRDSLHEPLYPAECREAGTTYAAQFFATMSYQVGSMPPRTVQAKLGQLPIMVKSAHCRLHGLSPAELIRHGEEENEMGGYFICNGNERVIRLLIAPRRNYPMAITRKVCLVE
jgi:DNA-directed RNA polymerase I subunit RPA2